MSSESMAFISDGRAFQRRGPATANARSPKRVRVLGTMRRSLSVDLNVLVALWLCINSLIYLGASPFLALYTRRMTLNLTRWLIGSQWSCLSMGVMCWCLGVLVTMCAATFWTLWSLLNKHSGKPWSRPLFMSNLDVINAWTSCSVVLGSRYS